MSAGAWRVGLIAVSDHPPEYAPASPDAAGIAHAELSAGVPSWLEQELARLAATSDAVIAFPHWGPNMTTAPARWQRRVARELQRAGAGLVAGHSSHVFHGVEWGAPAPILTDLGDALDDYAVDPLLRNDLGILAIWRPDGAEAELELVGLKLDFCHTAVADAEDAEWIATRLAFACGQLGTKVDRLAEARFRIRP